LHKPIRPGQVPDRLAGHPRSRRFFGGGGEHRARRRVHLLSRRRSASIAGFLQRLDAVALNRRRLSLFSSFTKNDRSRVIDVALRKSRG